MISDKVSVMEIIVDREEENIKVMKDGIGIIENIDLSEDVNDVYILFIYFLVAFHYKSDQFRYDLSRR